MNYRERCFSSYEVTWDVYHGGSEREYELYARQWARVFLRFLPRDRSAAILDVGCGAGHCLYALHKLGYTNARGIDQSEGMLHKTRQLGITQVECANMFEYLPAHPDTFDVIISNDVIEHLYKDEVFQYLDAMRTALKPGSTCIIRTPNCANVFAGRGRYIDFTHEVGFTQVSLTVVLKTAGFEDPVVYGMGPTAHDLPSFLRVCLWQVVRLGLILLFKAQQGSGRGKVVKEKMIFEPMMFAVARRPSSGG